MTLPWLERQPLSGNLVLRTSDFALIIIVFSLLAILIVPLPTMVLDICLGGTFVLSVIVFMIAITLQRPLDFSILPTLLLMTTVVRLFLNIATSRLIISRGGEAKDAAGEVVVAFGQLMMSDDTFVGIILFMILSMVNFLVITRGVSRVAEVSARFYLDSLPGKQMAIDAELASGAIDEAVASARRSDLEKESIFYASMDGASKFMRGDAICSVIIIVLNFAGGIGIGMVRQDLSFNAAFNTFSILTIGDGLVSQIPAILFSTAAGIVVTGGGSKSGAAKGLGRQFARHQTSILAAVFSAILLVIASGIPITPFAISSSAILFVVIIYNTKLRVESKTPQSGDSTKGVTSVVSRSLDPLRIEIGYGLLELAGDAMACIPEHIRRLRSSLFEDLGVTLPTVRIQDNSEIGPYDYVFRVRDIMAGSGELRTSMMLAISPRHDHTTAPMGESCREAAFGMPACWIKPNETEYARSIGWVVVEPVTALMTHLAEVIKDNINDIISFRDVEQLLGDLPSDYHRLLREIVPSCLTFGGFRRVLQMLLDEHISVRNMPMILEAVQEATSTGPKSSSALLIHVRMRLARQISEMYSKQNGYLPAIVLSPKWEEVFLSSLNGPLDERQLSLREDQLLEFVRAVRAAVERPFPVGDRPVVLTNHQIRLSVRTILNRIKTDLPVIAQVEVHPRINVKIIGTI